MASNDFAALSRGLTRKGSSSEQLKVGCAAGGRRLCGMDELEEL